MEALVQTASQQAVVMAREQIDVARRELSSRARQAGPGVAMIGGGAVLAAMASGTGTAGLILLLARRTGPAAAALGVTGAYAGAGALLAREGLVRLREAGPLTLPEAPLPDAEGGGAAKRSTKSAAAKSSQRIKSDVGSPRKSASRTKSAAKSAASRPRAAGSKASRARGPQS